jgi:DNA-binding NarL/FixJ family response regulator
MRVAHPEVDADPMPAEGTWSASERIPVAVGQLGAALTRGLCAILTDDPGLDVVACGLAASELLDLLASRPVGVVFLDEREFAGDSLPRRLETLCPGIGVVVIADRLTRNAAIRMFALGARACLPARAPEPLLRAAVHRAVAGEHFFVPMDAVGRAGRKAQLLTVRERSVAELLQAGRTNAEIAAELYIGIETVRTHVAHIYRKLGIGTRAELLDAEL